MLQPATLTFLKTLKKNNNKEWFDKNRKTYESAKADFAGLLQEVIHQFAKKEPSVSSLLAKNCMFRINRDVRFSKDKSPYKTNFGALVGPGGWAGKAYGYFISLEPHGQTMVAGGLYSPTPEQLERFRQVIAGDATEFKQVTQARDFVEVFGEIEGERLKTAPKGYEKTHPEIELLQLKQITVIHRFSDQAVTAAEFPSQVLAACGAMKPFIGWLERAIG